MCFSFFGKKLVLGVLTALMLLAGCRLGRQEPKLSSAGFSPRGEILAYTYNEVFINQYHSKGNRVHQQGNIHYYLQLIETGTGKKLLSEPYKAKEMIDVLYNDGENIWLQSLNSKKGRIGLAIYNIADRTMRFTAEKLNNLNPGIVLDVGSNIFVDQVNKRVVAMATDGRYYDLDARTGKSRLTPSVDGRIGASTTVSGNSNNKAPEFKPLYAPILLSQLTRNIEGYRAPGDERGPLKKNHRPDSKETFLKAGFVLAKPAFGGLTQNALMDFREHLFVCSKVTTDNEKDLLVTMVRRSDLRSAWTDTLPALSRVENSYHEPYFELAGGTLFVVNSSHLISIDAQSGKMNYAQLLFRH